MANEFSPTVQPQMPDSPDLSAKFMTGVQVGNSIWQAHANNNAKQQAMENQLAQYALRAQQMQHENTMREGYFNLAKLKQDTAMQNFQTDMQWKMYKEQEDTRDRDRNYDLRDWGQQVKEQKADEFIQRKQNEATGTAGMNQDLANLAGQETQPSYEKDVLNLGSKWAPYGPAAIQNIVQNRLNAATVMRDHAKRAVDADEKDFYDNIGRKIGGGNTLQQNLDWIEHYENLPDDKQGGWFGTSAGAHTTGKKQIVDPNTGNVISTQDTGYLENLRNQYHSIMQRKANIADPINRPDIGVYSPVPLPTDRSQWQVGHSYYSPVNGQPAQWTGTEFLPLGQGSPHPQPDPTPDPNFPQADT